MELADSTLQVNHFARKKRHFKVFSKSDLVRIHLSDVISYVRRPLDFVLESPAVIYPRRFFIALRLLVSEFVPVAPQGRLLFKAGFIAVAALALSSLSPGGTLTYASMSYSQDYIHAYDIPNDVLVFEGNYMEKVNPPTNEANRVGMTDYAMHTVESGQTLSMIAQRYGVTIDTIKWANDPIRYSDTIRIGQKLKVPPVNGIGHSVAKGDTLDSIAKKYAITSEAIIAQNALESDVLSVGQSIFLPNAKPIEAPPVYIARTNSYSSNARATSYAPSNAAPAVGRIFIYPTRGKITQGYRAGHYALDIGDRSMPPVWAAGAGTVIKASSGTWGGGYGNHVIIDHGNGLQSLYAHFDSVNVSVGDYVSQGDIIGVMGNTGRVYGATGIHLHWEVIQNGIKQYPGNYYQ